MLPWADMMRLALERGLAPEAFWHLSVREWLWLTEPSKLQFGARELKSLMEAYPDG